MTLAEKLNAVVSKAQKRKHHDENRSQDLRKEVSVFDATGERIQNLDTIFSAVMSIPATPEAPKRAFSAAGLSEGKGGGVLLSSDPGRFRSLGGVRAS